MDAFYIMTLKDTVNRGDIERMSILLECKDPHEVRHELNRLCWANISPMHHAVIRYANGKVFVSSVYNVACMYVRMFVIRDGM